MQRSWLLNDLYVHPTFRGKGISKKLIEAAKQLARGTNAAGLLLETEKTNITGNQLYPSAGFVLYNETNFYWWDSK
jgi:GNAT superfamily N-acetyltransferase